VRVRRAGVNMLSIACDPTRQLARRRGRGISWAVEECPA
jgi:hypothetical protein